MRKFIPLLLLSIFSLVTPLTAQDCVMSSAQVDLVTPRVKVRHHPTGSLWTDGSRGKFIVEDETLSTNPVSVAFAASFWAGGVDEGNNLKVAGNAYGINSGYTDWWPGPLNDEGQSPAENCQNFDRIWTLNAEDINAFEMDYNDNGVIDNPIHPTILIWPGKDNPLTLEELGFELPAGRELAPFIDRDNDGIYNPMNGDLPDIKGAKVAHWWIFNDNGNIHSTFNGDPIKIDVGVLAYSFDESAFEASTIFYEYQITNKAIEPIKDLHVGLWLDCDLGCYMDDYIGSLPSENLAFVYNQNEEDGEAGICESSVYGFENGIPLFGIRVLEGTKTAEGVDNGMSSFIYYNSIQVFNPNPANPVTEGPSIPMEMYNTLRGIWKDGTPISFGGDGYDPASTNNTNFAYPDPPNSTTGWSMCNPFANASDRGLILGSGATRLDPGQGTKFAFAAIVTQKVEQPCPDITPLVTAANDAQEIYDQLPSELSENATKVNFSILPNPAIDIVNIRTEEAEQIQSIHLFNISGQLIRAWESIDASTYEIDVENLSFGMYLVKVQMDDGKVGVKRVLVK